MEFKDLVRFRRKQLNMSMEDLAKKVGVSKATVQRWESGEIENVRRDKISKLADALETTPAYLMGWDPFYDTYTKIPQWYSFDFLSSQKHHDSAMELVERLQKKYSDDGDVVKLCSLFNVYLQQIDNLKLTDLLNNNPTKEYDLETSTDSILNYYFDLNATGKKLINDYINMIHFNDEYIDQEIVFTGYKNKGGFLFYFRNK